MPARVAPPEIGRGTDLHVSIAHLLDGQLTWTLRAPAEGGRTQDHYNRDYADFAKTHEKHAGGASATGGGMAGLAGVVGLGAREEGAAVEPPAGSTPPPRQRAT